MKKSEIIMIKVASALLKLTVVVLLAVGAWNFQAELNIRTITFNPGTSQAEVKFLGITIADNPKGLGDTLEVISISSTLFFTMGFATAKSIRDKEFETWVAWVLFSLISFVFVTTWPVEGFNTACLMVLVYSFSYIVGLANWPLWHLCDKLIDQNPEENST